MGDVILSTHIPKLLKSKYPDSQIDFLTFSSLSELFKYNPYVNNIIIFDKFKDKLFDFKNKILKNYGKYDIIFDLHKNFRSYFISFGLAGKIRRIKKNRLKKILLVKFKINLYRKIKLIPDLYKDVIQSNENSALEIWLEKDRLNSKYLPESNQINKIKTIAIAPGAKHFTKRWIPQYFSKLMNILKNHYNCRIILIGGSEDFDLCNQIISESEIEAENFAGKTNILQTAELLDKCELLITNDSGVMHIGAARQIPIVAIFGSTVKEFGFTPYNCNSIIIEKDLSCRPCTHIGTSNCKKGHFNCMKLITPEEVFEIISDKYN
jgi:lipopolysaccharide heptosyltransferase II